MNRIIVVTGSASGIGEACANLVEKKGDRVIRLIGTAEMSLRCIGRRQIESSAVTANAMAIKKH